MTETNKQDELLRLAQDAGFVVNAVGQITLPAPHEDCTKYLAKFAQLMRNTCPTPSDEVKRLEEDDIRKIAAWLDGSWCNPSTNKLLRLATLVRGLSHKEKAE